MQHLPMKTYLKGTQGRKVIIKLLTCRGLLHFPATFQFSLNRDKSLLSEKKLN